MLSYVPVTSDFGTLIIVWGKIEGRPRVVRVFLPAPGASALNLAQAAFPSAAPQSSPLIADLAERMGLFLKGQAVDFDLGIVALERCSEFQARVLQAEYRIPRGQVATYGGIARYLGIPKGARAVGGALARNPFPIVVPCHRAIRSDGGLGGFQGGVEMKRALLEFEGIEVSPTGSVLTERYCY